MAGPLFTFVQAEYPWALGPADGRYLVRGAGAEVSHIVVLATQGAPRRRRLARRRTRRATSPDPAPVTTSRATVINAAPLPSVDEARRWLGRIDAADAGHGALEVLNGVLFAHRIATADGALHEVSVGQALVVRAGWGEGEQVAEGRWGDAAELLVPERRRRRTAVLRPQERLAVLLGGRGRALLTEELALRTRLDLDHGRERHAALELRHAYAAAMLELMQEGGVGLRARMAELEQLRPGVEAAAQAVLGGGAPAGGELAHALGRLEAALRARTAAGFQGLPEPAEP
jgi:hypothetical protein